MLNGKPLFQGFSEKDQLNRIFRIRGTPNEKTVPALKSYPEWKVKFNLILRMQHLKSFQKKR